MDSLSSFLQPSFKSANPSNDLLARPLSQPSARAPEIESDSAQNHSSGDHSEQSPAALLEAAVAKVPGGFFTSPVDSAADFSPQSVADRIVGFVDSAIAQRAGSEIEIQSMLQQAREGIAQGINDARATLEAMGKLSESVAEQIDKTESLVFKGLDTLEQALTSNQQENSALISESASLSSLLQQTREASIEIVTQDGDRVEVSYSAFVQSSANQSYSATTQGQALSFEYSATSSTAFQFSVQGNLDAEERASINELLSDVGDIAAQFFQGDVQAAFNASLELGFDSEELKSFSVDLQKTTRVQVAQSYQRTEQLYDPVTSDLAIPELVMPELAIPELVISGPVNTLPVATPVSPRPAVDVLSQLDNLLQQVKQNEVIKEPENMLKSILNDMLDSLNQVYDSPVQSYIKDIIG
ncbi:hypothetical protein MNBD_GAMMA09-1459 [hydrothermal vent metagenome]|uniref:DUF5610 domain-containing protein n=1 Tax=hydrothermal vent metagenome TaxID=652676 RepID=A0A3B0XQQ5_9ZZZZ